MKVAGKELPDTKMACWNPRKAFGVGQTAGRLLGEPRPFECGPPEVGLPLPLEQKKKPVRGVQWGDGTLPRRHGVGGAHVPPEVVRVPEILPGRLRSGACPS